VAAFHVILIHKFLIKLRDERLDIEVSTSFF